MRACTGSSLRASAFGSMRGNCSFSSRRYSLRHSGRFITDDDSSGNGMSSTLAAGSPKKWAFFMPCGRKRALPSRAMNSR